MQLPQRYISSQRKRPKRLILTNTAVCLGHQHDLIEKEKCAQITLTSTATLSRWQSGRCPAIAHHPWRSGQLQSLYQEEVIFISSSVSHSGHMVLPDSKDARTIRLPQGLWNRDFSVFLPQLINSTPSGSTRNSWTTQVRTAWDYF